MFRWIAVALLALQAAPSACAAEVSVAVAANFSAPLSRLAQAFEAETGHRLLASPGSTGKFYSQIRNGAPFDVLLAADQETPQRLQREGLADAPFTYAIGKLVLWSRQAGLVDSRGEILRAAASTPVAVADPKLAPYGAAGFQVLSRLGLEAALQPRLVIGADIGQTYQFVASGNAPYGFVALSQVFSNGRLREGSYWLVPSALYAPLRQDAALLAHGRNNPAAQAWLEFLRSARARSEIAAFGYELP